MSLNDHEQSTKPCILIQSNQWFDLLNLLIAWALFWYDR